MSQTGTKDSRTEVPLTHIGNCWAGTFSPGWSYQPGLKVSLVPNAKNIETKAKFRSRSKIVSLLVYIIKIVVCGGRLWLVVTRRWKDAAIHRTDRTNWRTTYIARSNQLTPDLKKKTINPSTYISTRTTWRLTTILFGTIHQPYCPFFVRRQRTILLPSCN